MYTDITGIILASGKPDKKNWKSYVERTGEKTTVEHLVNIFQKIFKKVLLISENPAKFQDIKVDVIRDDNKNSGLLSKLYKGLSISITEKNFIASSDLPFLSEEMIRYIADFSTKKLIAVPKAEGEVQFLTGLYSKKVLPHLEDILNKGLDEKDKDNLMKLIDKTGVQLIDAESLPFYDPHFFFNINKQVGLE